MGSRTTVVERGNGPLVGIANNPGGKNQFSEGNPVAIAALRARKRAVIEGFQNSGHLGKACAAIGATYSAHYDWLRDDPEYAEEYRKSQEIVAQKLEDEVLRRAHDGVPEPVFYKGEVCGEIQKYSDILAIFALKGMRPDKYRDNAQTTINIGAGLVDRLQAARQRRVEVEAQPAQLAAGDPDVVEAVEVEPVLEPETGSEQDSDPNL